MINSTLQFIKMRPIDLFIDLSGLDEKTSSRLKKGGNSVRTVYSLSKVGRSVASKANVVMSLVDATVSVLDAISSYARYRQATEITSQLEMEAEMLRVQLSELNEQFYIFKEEADVEVSASVTHVKRKLAEDLLEFQISMAQYQRWKGQVKRVGDVLSQLRRDSVPGCLKLYQIEKEYYKLVAKQIQAAIVVVDR